MAEQCQCAMKSSKKRNSSVFTSLDLKAFLPLLEFDSDGITLPLPNAARSLSFSEPSVILVSGNQKDFVGSEAENMADQNGY